MVGSDGSAVVRRRPRYSVRAAHHDPRLVSILLAFLINCVLNGVVFSAWLLLSLLACGFATDGRRLLNTCRRSLFLLLFSLCSLSSRWAGIVAFVSVFNSLGLFLSLSLRLASTSTCTCSCLSRARWWPPATSWLRPDTALAASWPGFLSKFYLHTVYVLECT